MAAGPVGGRPAHRACRPGGARDAGRRAGAEEIRLTPEFLDVYREVWESLREAVSLYMTCDYVKNNAATVQKPANAFVRTLGWIKAQRPAEIAAKMPADYAGGNPALYEKAIGDSVGMFTLDGVMSADGARNVLNVLSKFSPNVKGHTGDIDLHKTYTTRFVAKAPKA